MQRRDFLKRIAGAATVACLPAGTLQAMTAATAPARPNIILIVSDDHGRDLGCYGNPYISTPNLDGLAADGVLFDNAFCTTSSCSPSRSVLLTGMHNHANGQYGLAQGKNNFHTKADVRSLPVRLAEGGYHTARVGKFHLNPAESYPFETTLQGGNIRNAAHMADSCMPLFESDDPRPFFLYFCPGDPHRGNDARKDLPHRPNGWGNENSDKTGKTYSLEEIEVPRFLPDIPEVRAELAQYSQSVSRLDFGIGHLISVLKETGIYENSLIIYVSDNGVPFPGAKTTLYEPGMHLPCIMKAPGKRIAGSRSEAMISWTDLAPTILDYAGLGEDSNGMHGHSVRPVLEQPDVEGWEEVYASHTFHEVTMYYPMRVLRERRYKLIWNIAHELPFPTAADLHASATWQAVLKQELSHYGQRTVKAYLNRPRYELYDLQEDPDEVVNLADDPAHRERLERMIEKLKSFQESTRDPWFLKWKHE